MFKINSHGDECESDSEDSESYLNETEASGIGTVGSDPENKLMKTDTMNMSEQMGKSIASSKKDKKKV